mmetsp:Transcript_66446/g.188535  ORF Transcript_66446/g.188535 Transcript_66446/m.188535 type:complete len:247 (+) Transcript_66446:2194-2934(+)
MKSSLLIFFFTPGLWRSVCSIMRENESTNAQSGWENLPGLSWQYFSANSSSMREIFWASPGSRKRARKLRRAASSSALAKPRLAISDSNTFLLKSLSSPRKSPIAVLSSPKKSPLLKSSATDWGFSLTKPPCLRCSRPRFGFRLNLCTPFWRSLLRCFCSHTDTSSTFGAEIPRALATDWGSWPSAAELALSWSCAETALERPASAFRAAASPAPSEASAAFRSHSFSSPISLTSALRASILSSCS